MQPDCLSTLTKPFCQILEGVATFTLNANLTTLYSLVIYAGAIRESVDSPCRDDPDARKSHTTSPHYV